MTAMWRGERGGGGEATAVSRGEREGGGEVTAVSRGERGGGGKVTAVRRGGGRRGGGEMTAGGGEVIAKSRGERFWGSAMFASAIGGIVRPIRSGERCHGGTERCVRVVERSHLTHGEAPQSFAPQMYRHCPSHYEDTKVFICVLNDAR